MIKKDTNLDKNYIDCHETSEAINGIEPKEELKTSERHAQIHIDR